MHKTANSVMLLCGAVGYEVFVPVNRLPLYNLQQEVEFYTYAHYREDGSTLFGLTSWEERELYQILLNVSGIGPKGALGLLSAMDADDLRFAVLSGDAKAIAKAPGIGAKTAQRVILDLKDKMEYDDAYFNREIAQTKATSTGVGSIDLPQKKEAIEALISLGYGQTETMKAVNSIDGIEDMDAGAVLKAALKKMF
jgi:Holliday junction DNA helicase RuvA